MRSLLEPLRLIRLSLPPRLLPNVLRKSKSSYSNNSISHENSQPKAQPKAQPKSAAADKHNAGAAKGTAKAAGNKKRRGRNSRPAKKTQEELDSEMADYFVTPAPDANANTAAAPTPAPAATGDADMDEIAVCAAQFTLPR